MRKQIFVLILLSLGLVAVPSCRSRRAVPPPQPAPPVTSAPAPEPAGSVPAPERDFVQPEAPGDATGQDVAEASRVARERRWIRDAFFALDASTLDEDAQEALRQSAAWLRQHPEHRLRIEGHCDERGTEQYDLALGERRASTAASYLAALGVERARIETVSYGEERPFEEGSHEAAWARNRRAHLVLAGRR